MPQYLAFSPQDFADTVSPKQAKSPETLGFFDGGDKGTRTPGLSIANAALYQLSYIPTARNILQHIRAKCKSFVLA